MPDNPEANDAAATREANRKNIRATWLISVLTMISRIFGYARFILVIHLFANMRWVSDALIFAFRIPSLFRNLLGEGALSAAFLPVFVRTREKDGPVSASALASQIATFLAAVGGVITVLGAAIFLALAHFWRGEGRELTLAFTLTAVFMGFMPLTCMAALLGGMLQGLRRFTLPACLSIIMNLGFLCGFAYVFWWQCNGDIKQLQPESVYSIALFVLAAGVLEVLIQIPVLLSEGIIVRPTLSASHPGVKVVAKAFVPTAVALGLVQINAFIDSLIAGSLSLASQGAITYLEVGFRFMQLPLGVFGIAIATATFPEFSSAAAARDDRKFINHMVQAVRMSAFFLLPASAILIAMADPIVRLTCQRPDLAFSHAAVYRSSLVLALYSAGLFFYSIRQVLVRAYYARGEYSFPVKVSVAMVFLNLTLNLILIHCPDPIRPFLAGSLERFNISADAFPNGLALNEAGLALATCLTAIIDSCILWRGIRVRLKSTLDGEAGKKSAAAMWKTIGSMASISAALGVMTWLFRNSIPYDPGFISLSTRTIVPCILAAGLFYIIATVLPLPELNEFFFSLFRKRAKAAKQPSAEK